MANSRAKGKRGENQLAKVLRLYGYDTRRGQQFKGGPDSPDVIGLPGIHIECKRQEQIRIYDWMSQSRADSGEDIPVVMFRKNNCQWLVTMELSDWIELYREWEAGVTDMLKYLKAEKAAGPFELQEEYQEAFSGITERRQKK